MELGIKQLYRKSVDSLSFFSDIHTHLLPCVDDGVSSVEEALEILSFLKTRGVKRLFFTPHIMAGYPLNNLCYLKERYHSFVELFIKPAQYKYPDVHLAAEYMLDEYFCSHLETGLLSYDGFHVLVEMSCLQPPLDFKEKIYKMQLYGYVPVLAHPERYLFLSLTDYQYLKEQGCLFQLNLFSLQGVYGSPVRSVADKLLKNGYYDFIGSDIHSSIDKDTYLNFLCEKKMNMRIKELIKQNETIKFYGQESN